MSIYISDEESRYIVKDENLNAAYEWLEDEGEFTYKVGHVDGCTWLSANRCEDMFCGYVSFDYMDYVMRFIDAFCESGSYACFRNDDEFKYEFAWKDDSGIHYDWRGFANPFEDKIEKLKERN